jgi:hypothetical protein
MPLVLHRREIARRADQRGYVHIVTAGVHHPDLLAGCILGPHMTGIREAGFLGNRQRVHVRSNQQPQSPAVVQARNHSVCLGPVRVAPDALSYLISGFSKLTG